MTTSELIVKGCESEWFNVVHEHLSKASTTLHRCEIPKLSDSEAYVRSVEDHLDRLREICAFYHQHYKPE